MASEQESKDTEAVVDNEKEEVIVVATNHDDKEDDDSSVDMTPDSNLADLNRRIWVVTTAGMPWMTGTAVNPLLRALYLTRGRPKDFVTLMIPWLEDPKSRSQLYGKDKKFETSSDQEEWIRDFCRTRAHCEEEEKNLRIQFYPSVYRASFGSIFPTVDICSLIPDDEADIAILEEPEHLNWIRVPPEEEKGAEDDNKERKDSRQLGWAYKFRHVVGILHTNYAAYMKDYGLGTGMIAAPAISMLSSIVVRAYCHRVIRLSGVLPSLAPNKEVTCNVHGVRSEFMHPPVPRVDDDNEEKTTYAPVYFIGKIIWAKGFDKVLKLQELFKKSGNYFEMDIYGGGNDEVHIARAFLGRKKLSDIESEEELKDEVQKSPSEADLKALQVFDQEQSLRHSLSNKSKQALEDQSFEIIRSRSGTSENVVQSGENPFSIIGDLSGQTLWTGLAASQAIYNLGDSMLKATIDMTFTEQEDNDGDDDTKSAGKKPKEKKSMFDPPRSIFELRRTPIPARFLGVKDHGQLRDIPEHKIFLNMSITEVLCTTTAEALAMGKFVIIPKHPSNTFFLQFPNCLAYESLAECKEKLSWALKNEPTPMTEEIRHRFTWEGANERLYEAAAISKKEAKERQESGQDEADIEVALRHVETTMKGRSVQQAVKKMILKEPATKK